MNVSFPIIHTNMLDALYAVPVVIIITEILKRTFSLAPPAIPNVAMGIGLLISIFISHRHSWVAGLFMGFFYGNAASGLYSMLKTQLLSYRNKV